jgi:hypothetical protein
MAKCPVCEERLATEFHFEFDGEICLVCNKSSKGEAGWNARSSQIELPHKHLNESVLISVDKRQGHWYVSARQHTWLCSSKEIEVL